MGVSGKGRVGAVNIIFAAACIFAPLDGFASINWCIFCAVGEGE